MIVLVDYSNVDAIARSKGLFFVVSTILDTIGPTYFSEGELVRVRLYGGWYEANSMSREAQALSAEVQKEYPAPFTISHGQKRVSLRVNVELAQSLAAFPRHVLLNTYRVRGLPDNLRHGTFPFQGCVAPASCALQTIVPLVQTGHCPRNGCVVPIDDVLRRGEQKLVDTMLVSDLIYLGQKETNGITIVSTDDDMWPGIQTTLAMGKKVIHIHPRPHRKTPGWYAKDAGGSYFQHTFMPV